MSQSATRVELEVDGEKAVVEDWYPATPSPSDPVAVNGERRAVRAQVEAGHRAPAATSPGARAPDAPGAVEPTGDGVPVVPPMPGKVVELRVTEGEGVRKGQVLLVLEAMKMRNEVVSPADGTVAGLAVQTGSNVRARETMLRIRSAS